MAKKTSIKERLKEQHGIYFTRRELYKALCAYNDSLNRVYTIQELETLLEGNDAHLEDFSEFLLNTFEPEIKITAA